MILVDANILLYASTSAYAAQFSQAKSWLDGAINNNERVGIPWESSVAFVRIATNRRIFEKPLSTTTAWAQVELWLSCANVWIPTPAEDHRKNLASLMPFCKGESGLIHDAHLAALSLSHGLTVYSADNDFARFPQVRWVNPLS